MQSMLGAPPYASLLVTALVVMGSPGPVTIGVTAAVTAFGLRRAVPYVLGSMTGTAAVTAFGLRRAVPYVLGSMTGTAAALVVVAVGLASALLAVPGLGPVLLAVSVGYLAWLAWKIATARPPATGEERPRTPPTWLHGVLLGVANPKAYAALGAVFTSHRLGLPNAALESVVKTLVLAGMVVLVHAGWAVAGTSMATALRRPRVSRVVNVVLATALLASAVPLVLELAP